MKSKPLLAIFIVVFIDILAFTLILPYLPLFAERFGATPTEIGFLITVFAFCQFLSGPTLGRLSDVYGRKPILAVSQFGTFIGFVLLATAGNLWVVFLARIIDGLTAGNITVAQATIADVTEPGNRTKAFGIIGVSFGLGFFVGPAISAYLIKYGYAAPAWAAAGLSFASIFSTLFLLPVRSTSMHSKIPLKEFLNIFDFKLILGYLRNIKTRRPLLQFFLFNFSFTCSFAGFAMYAERRFTWMGHPFGVREIGYVYAYLGLIGIFIQGYFLGKVVEKIGDKKTTALGFLSQGIGYCAYAFVYKIPALLGAATLGSVGSGFSRAAITSQLSKAAGAEEQGTILGVSQSFAAIASIVAPIVTGLLIQHVSLEAWALLAGISALLSLRI